MLARVARRVDELVEHLLALLPRHAELARGAAASESQDDATRAHRSRRRADDEVAALSVDAEKANDQRAAKLCKQIARAVERELSYPGQIKVHVIRETRSIRFAV